MATRKRGIGSANGKWTNLKMCGGNATKRIQGERSGYMSCATMEEVENARKWRGQNFRLLSHLRNQKLNGRGYLDKLICYIYGVVN